MKKKFTVVEVHELFGGHFEYVIRDANGNYAEGGERIPGHLLSFM
jgi:hypothetical protein